MQHGAGGPVCRTSYAAECHKQHRFAGLSDVRPFESDQHTRHVRVPAACSTALFALSHLTRAVMGFRQTDCSSGFMAIHRSSSKFMFLTPLGVSASRLAGAVLSEIQKHCHSALEMG